jgi:predicted nucleic acid-binding protein
MSDHRVFVDTNVLVYAYDASAGPKREAAKKLLIDLWESGLGVISTQVIQEFFVTVTRKLPKRMDSHVARNVVEDLLKWDVVIVDGPMMLDAIDLQIRQPVSFWDALIIAAAVRRGCGFLLSEDLKHGMKIHGVTVRNPFL